jgi:hypothetical protein
MTESVLRLLLDVRRASKGGAETIAQRQRLRLAEIVNYARAHSPYYRELYADYLTASMMRQCCRSRTRRP